MLCDKIKETHHDQQPSIWDQHATQYDKSITAHDDLYNKTIAATKSHLSLSDRILDFACESGEMSLDLAPHVSNIHGIDIASKMIDLAQQKAEIWQIDNVNFSQMDVMNS